MKTKVKKTMYILICSLLLMFCSVLVSMRNTGASELSEKQAKLAGKNIAFIGDSLTANNGTKKYIDVIRDKTGANCVNYGLNESSVALNKVTKYESFVTRYHDVIANHPPDYFDIIVIFGGTNDYAYDVPLGDMSTGQDTYIGALTEIVYNMQAKNPKAKIVLVNPLISNYYGRAFDYTKNNAGLFVEDYRNGVRLVARMLGCAVYDAHMLSGLNPNNGYMSEKYYTNRDDGVHPNEAGHERIAIPLINLFNSLY